MEANLIRLENKVDERAQAKKEFEKSVRPFIEKSLSDETRRAYGRVIKEFFNYQRKIDPVNIKPLDVIRWRDSLIAAKKSAATVSFKLSVVRSLFEYLKAGGFIQNNPALSKLVAPPKLSEDLRGRALNIKEVNYILSGPDREKPEGARDYAILLTLLRTSLRVAEVCSLKSSSIKWSHGRWTLKFKIKGGRERTIPLPPDVKKAIDEYLRLDRDRRQIQKTDGGSESWIFQPTTNYRTRKQRVPNQRQQAIENFEVILRNELIAPEYEFILDDFEVYLKCYSLSRRDARSPERQFRRLCDFRRKRPADCQRSRLFASRLSLERRDCSFI